MWFGTVLLMRSLLWEVIPPSVLLLPLPDSQKLQEHYCECKGVRACWVWAPDFRSWIPFSDITVRGRNRGIWFKPAGGYSAVAVEHIIAGVILLLAPHLHPPPTRQDDIYRVPCSGLWPWKPSLLLNAHPTLPAPQHVSRIAENVGMGSPQGRAEWLTDLCAWSALTQNMEMWAASWFYTSDLQNYECKCSASIVFFYATVYYFLFR